MKITETIERECCQNQDLKRYKGVISKHSGIDPKGINFCIFLWTNMDRLQPNGCDWWDSKLP